MNARTSDTPLQYQHFQTVLDCLSEAVLTVDRDFLITGFNRAAEQLTGFRREEAVGRPCFEIVHNRLCVNATDCPLAEALANGGGNGRRELTVVDGDTARKLRVTFETLRSSDGRIVGGVEAITVGGSTWGNELPAAPSLPTGALPILEATEKRAIEVVLQRHRWNRSSACQELGLSRTTLWRKMRKLGISPRPPRAPAPTA
ncbi:MAG: PAS domain-containing protein [Phycisphaerales bacterium]|nr:PAS domain-containing protein [Phycisphaerales bacterium]